MANESSASIVVAIDGPSGVGKSVAAKKLAQALDFHYAPSGGHVSRRRLACGIARRAPVGWRPHGRACGGNLHRPHAPPQAIRRFGWTDEIFQRNWREKP